MALLHVDGFDHYGSTTDMVEAGYSGTIQNAPQTTNAAFGVGRCLRREDVNSAATRFQTNSTSDTIIVGAHIRLDGLPSVNDRIDQPFVILDSGGAEHIHLEVNADGSVTVTRGSSSDLGTTAPNVVKTLTYQHWELKVTVNNTTGSVQLKIDEATVINLTNVDTQNGGLAEASRVGLGDPNSGFGTPAMYWDNLFIMDDTGSALNDFIGAHRVFTQRPDGDSSLGSWTANTGNAWDAINDDTPDDDTTYITNAANDTAKFTLEDGTFGTVAAIASYVLAKKDDVAASTMRSVIDSGGFIGNGQTITLTEGYVGTFDIFETDPQGGGAWTDARIDALLVGVERLT